MISFTYCHCALLRHILSLLCNIFSPSGHRSYFELNCYQFSVVLMFHT